MLTTLRAALPGRGEEMPADIRRRTVSIDPDHLTRYAHVCGFTVRDSLPPTYPHVLAHPLLMELLAASPFSAVGVVHIANRIVQHRPASLGETLELRVHAGPFAPHRRGRTFDFVSAAYVGHELVWEEFSTMLKRGDGDDSLPREEPPEDPPVTARWTLPDDLGRRYAAVSGDHNPIHLHGLAARAFGFPRAIAHGMWTKARCLAALRLPDALEVEASFRKPVLLPSTVTFGEAGGAFAVHGHLHGEIRDRCTASST
jgi:acyl dehydratase